MVKWLDQIPSLVISLWVVWAFWLIGNKKRMGWLVGLTSEAAWAAYAIWLAQWGLLVSCGVFMVVYWRNWRRWRDEESIVQED